MVLNRYLKATLKYKWWFFTMLLLILGSVAVDLVLPILFKRFFNVFSLTENQVAMGVKVILLIFFVRLFGWVVRRTSGLIVEWLETRVMADLKNDAFHYLLRHSYSFFTNNFGGSLTQRVGRYGRAYEVLMDRISFNIFPTLLQVIGIIIIINHELPRVALLMSIWLVVYISFNFFFARWKNKYEILRTEADSHTTAVLADAMTNHNPITLFNGLSFEMSRFMHATADQARKTFHAWKLGEAADAVQGIITVVTSALILYFSLIAWRDGKISVGTIVMFQLYIDSLVMRIWDLSKVFRNIYESSADAKEMVEILETKHEVTDFPDARPLLAAHGKIEFKNLTFNYNKSKNVIKEVNLIISPKEKIALVGHSGAGKTTFVRLLLRYYNLTAGKILIDDQDISSVTLESLYNAIALVPQDPILFHRTLMENIRYGKPDATDEEVFQAAKRAHADEFIRSFPQGYDTFVGERGVKLSGGERQRVAIARALLKDAPILILDEATSSLDSQAEALIQEAIHELMQNRTVVVIAHRLSTIKEADRIIVMEEGKIIEEGSHAKLLKNQKSLYKKLWDLQAGGFIVDSE